MDLNYDREKLIDICCRWRIRQLALFGSRANGAARADSDVDLLVTFAPEAQWSLWDIVTLREEMMTCFGRSVDLVEPAALKNPFRRKTVLARTEVLYAA